MLTQDTIDAGSIDLGATVRADSSAGAVEADTETTHLIDGIGGIEIVDAVEIAPAGDGSVTVGETVRMSYMVTNTGNVTLDALELKGDHGGHAGCEVVAGEAEDDAAGWSFWSRDDVSLAPGDVALCVMPDHRVEDVSEAMLAFTATATGTAPREVRIGNDSPEGDEVSAKAVETSTEVTASITTMIDTRPAPVTPPLAATGAAVMAVAPFAVGLLAVGGLLLLARRRSIARD
ncbi:MAG TPA: hypothetical protein VNJ54_10980 [Plantibacter sp.]|uniref:DUF7507 domain-containing protein n=1 Tax=unclassified Plantibacter TaxID=2624265 RepID=UPI002C822B79|nr:hypothetical protein [Plantibacter sp.]